MDRRERNAWVTVIAIEVAYILGARLINLAPFPLYSWQSEALRIPLRLAGFLAYGVLLRPWLSSRKLDWQDLRRPSIAFALLVFLSVPLLASFLGHGWLDQLFGIAASVSAALKEEATFRALIQSLLARHMRVWQAVAVTTAVFVAYHIGVLPHVWYAYAQIVPASILLGVVYARTGNFWLAAGIHAVFDLLAEFGPLLTKPIAYTTAFALLVAAAGATVVWGWATLRRA